MVKRKPTPKKKPSKKKDKPVERTSAVKDFIEKKEKEREPPSIVELKREIKSLKTKLVRGQGVEELIRECVEQIYEKPVDFVYPKSPKRQGKGEEHIACAHISDTQLGKVTDDYDSVVGAERLRKYAELVVQRTEVYRTFCKVEELHIWLGGDMVEGEKGNYPSQPYDVEHSVIRQAMRNASDIFEGLIHYWLKHFKRIKVIGVVGNHGRNAVFAALRHKETNWDRVFYWNLKDRVIGSDNHPNNQMRSRIEFDVPEGSKFWSIDNILGWGMLVIHGDQIRGWAGIPFYGVQKKSHGWADTMPEHWDAMFFGHFHTPAAGTINHRRWFANGTTESSSDFAFEALAAAGDPCQRLLFISREGGIVGNHLLWLTDRRPIAERQVAKAVKGMSETQLRRELKKRKK